MFFMPIKQLEFEFEFEFERERERCHAVTNHGTEHVNEG